VGRAVLEARIRNLEATLKYIHRNWSNPFMRLVIERALVGRFELIENKEDVNE
jgi:hypothetical protein